MYEMAVLHAVNPVRFKKHPISGDLRKGEGCPMAKLLCKNPIPIYDTSYKSVDKCVS